MICLSFPGGLYSVGGQGRYDILRQIEKNKIREEILAKERRQYMIEQDIRRMENSGGYPSLSSLMLGHTDSHHHHHHLHRVPPQLLRGQAYETVDGRIAMPFQEDYGVTGHQFQRRPNINEIITSPPKAGEKQFIDMVSDLSNLYVLIIDVSLLCFNFQSLNPFFSNCLF